MSLELAIGALLLAVWRRKSKNGVLVHSDQGDQYGRSLAPLLQGQRPRTEHEPTRQLLE
jgi:transposase InsO family protein